MPLAFCAPFPLAWSSRHGTSIPPKPCSLNPDTSIPTSEHNLPPDQIKCCLQRVNSPTPSLYYLKKLSSHKNKVFSPFLIEKSVAYLQNNFYTIMLWPFFLTFLQVCPLPWASYCLLHITIAMFLFTLLNFSQQVYHYLKIRKYSQSFSFPQSPILPSRCSANIHGNL